MDAATATVIDGQQAFAMIGTVMWTMLRTGAMLMAMPLIGTRALPMRIRVLLAGALALAISPMLPPPPASGGIDAATVLGVARELALGVAMGFALRLVFEAGALAGELVSLGMGLAFAQMTDPLRGTRSGVVAQWFYIAFGLLFFASDGHLAMISLLVRSYQALPLAAAWPDAPAMLGVVPELFSLVLRGGVTLALPVMVAMLATNLAFGVLARAAPALNPIQLGLPVALLLGLFLLAALATEVASPIQGMFEHAFGAGARVFAP
ncbi:flagellar biosynthetic protein FliR [Pseudoxanthomonas broegbernensis]|uniref:Flagellar biosynthetic protein FliR n=1 Tax=Pseudoxanthomonas broegbernensis TaxID=83619 RepID=A0A7V8GL85_9GAMM|nr:flagellar biosynthetic protein FliR [Pseudoxanthomonas broegbernensis]KAF1685616.1 flagellar biosynthetic protein FliR [Pseudoxanthomonas broegbernensis]MBB6065991.1 flagellar biosynthetic protein FliR [Pseudoxanthomonas broegbernensis]